MLLQGFRAGPPHHLDFCTCHGIHAVNFRHDVEVLVGAFQSQGAESSRLAVCVVLQTAVVERFRLLSSVGARSCNHRIRWLIEQTSHSVMLKCIHSCQVHSLVCREQHPHFLVAKLAIWHNAVYMI